MTPEPDTEELIRRAGHCDASAIARLFEHHRQRLKRMITLRMDERLARRVDPSDVVQETFVEALRKIHGYLQDRPVPFYPWLRQIAWNRLIDLHRRHVVAKERAVDREGVLQPPLSARSATTLADKLVSHESSPSAQLVHSEMRHRVQAAIMRLPSRFREVLVLRHLEQISVAEIAAVLGVAEGTVKSRHFRALAQMRELLKETP